MARKPSPWFWPERNGWFTILGGRRHPLGDHPAELPPPVKRKGKWVAPPTIERAFHALLAAPAERIEPRIEPAVLTVSELLDKFLDWTQKNKAARTFEWYCNHGAVRCSPGPRSPSARLLAWRVGRCAPPSPAGTPRPAPAQAVRSSRYSGST